MNRITQPAPIYSLADVGTHALLRAADASSHGLAARNYALVQVMPQVGLRIGEVVTPSHVCTEDAEGPIPDVV